MVVGKGTRGGQSWVVFEELCLSVVMLGCRSVVRMVAVVAEVFELGTGMPKGSSSSAVVARRTDLCGSPDSALLMVGMQLVCKDGRRRWSCC